MILRRPRLADKEAVVDMIEEFEQTQSAHDGGFWDTENFVYEEWLESNRDIEMGLGIPEGWVPAVQLVAFARDGQAVGFLNLRLRLNDHLLQEGGHIGYSIRPSARGKGLAKEQLRQGLQVAKSKNIKRVLVTCDRDNAASRGVIIANGGVLEDIRGGKERYWIDID